MKARIFSVLLLIGIAASVFAIGVSAYTPIVSTPSWVVDESGYPYTRQYGVETWCHAYDTYADEDFVPDSRAVPPAFMAYPYVNHAEIMCLVEGEWDFVGQEEEFSSSGLSYDPNAAEAWSYEILSDNILTDEGIAN